MSWKQLSNQPAKNNSAPAAANDTRRARRVSACATRFGELLRQRDDAAKAEYAENLCNAYVVSNSMERSMTRNSDTADAANNSEAFLAGVGLYKHYPPITAVDNISIAIKKGDVLALVGANGAGKSTLTKILSGEIPGDGGSLRIGGRCIDMAHYSPGLARRLGIRVVHQELSLCRNLTVYENFHIEQFQHIPSPLGWRGKTKRMAREALDTVFPGNNIDVSANLASLSIAQQQMVEIARATSDPALQLLILDEPTSALPARQTEQLQNYIKNSAQHGVTYIYISHRLREIMNLANRIYIMRNGAEIWQCRIGDTSEEDMIRRMGEVQAGDGETAPVSAAAARLNSDTAVEFDNFTAPGLKSVTCSLHGGEVVGVTGLEGNGQLELLQQIFALSGARRSGAKVAGKAAYIAGDRKKEGIFPLWSIADNMSISRIAASPLFSLISPQKIGALVRQWHDKLKVKSAGPGAPITSLSGGNQQKALIARAMAVDANIMLLDDPTRGVDVATKTQLYAVFRDAAAAGKLAVWRTTDDAELEQCDRLLVMSSGAVAGEFDAASASHEEILKASFRSKGGKQSGLAVKKTATLPLWLFSLIAMALLYSICGSMSPRVFSKFGVELLAVGFAPFVFAALAQTYIIGLGHIDLGIGAFMGLVNVVCATVLDADTLLGLLALAGLLAAYALMGVVVYVRNVPAIIITLGMSFVWMGLAFFLQDMPGGHTPDWMTTLFNFDNSILQGVLIYLLLFIFLAVAVYRSRYGTVMRGFGNNAAAVVSSGWSKGWAFFFIYLIAGVFAMMGGISFSAITGASDVNASATFTMLTVAAVIIGGGYFEGGVVTHLGAVFGAITLTMISVLLGLFNISTDYTATIQGMALLVILSLRILKRKEGGINA